MDESEEGPLPKALLVDDEKEVADAYALRLRGLCDIETVYHGEDALAAVEDKEFDVVLLDRHMPGMSGDEVLTKLDEQDCSARIIMVTAIDPGFDVLDMPFDDYLCKPIEREDIRAAVRQQCAILGYETLGEYFSVASKRRVIETEVPEDERAGHEQYQETSDRAGRLKRRAERLLDDAEALFDTFEEIEREGR
jgi:DNA-binding response OmpR family regulator